MRYKSNPRQERLTAHGRTVHFDSISNHHEGAAEFSLHDGEPLPAVATVFHRCLGAVVGLPALA